MIRPNEIFYVILAMSIISVISHTSIPSIPPKGSDKSFPIYALRNDENIPPLRVVRELLHPQSDEPRVSKPYKTFPIQLHHFRLQRSFSYDDLEHLDYIHNFTNFFDDDMHFLVSSYEDVY